MAQKKHGDGLRVEWAKNIGSSGQDDTVNYIVQTRDGGYLIAAAKQVTFDTDDHTDWRTNNKT